MKLSIKASLTTIYLAKLMRLSLIKLFLMVIYVSVKHNVSMFKTYFGI